MIPVIMYHCINKDLAGNPHGRLGFTPDEFRSHLRWFQRAGYSIISVSDLWEWLNEGHPQDLKPVVFTFDDGFRDNLQIVAPIMAQYGAKGTVYANPDLAPEPGSCSKTETWGYLDRDQMQELADGGVLEIQSHTWDHLRVFSGPKVVDTYTKDRFDQLWWVVWLLKPELRSQWQGDVRRFATEIPDGQPIFENDRHLIGPRFHPDPGFVKDYILQFQEGKTTTLPLEDSLGKLESLADYSVRCQDSLARSKSILSQWTGKKVEHLCFPGGAYNPDLLEWAAEAGYQTYMRSSREQGHNDQTLFQSVADQPRGNNLIGLARLSFSNDYPRFLRNAPLAYLSAGLKIRSFEERPFEKLLHESARRIRNLLP